ncbi:MAG: TSUP family transporter [Streptosporangiales bacterium]|nr:TSUP family transporter [Streptosporangiales bacterium]
MSGSVLGMALPAEVSGLRLLVGAPLALAAGYVHGLTGLGFAIVFTPLFVLVVPNPHDVVFLALLLGTVLCAVVLIEARGRHRVRHGGPLLVGAFVGTPVGVFVLTQIAAGALTIVIAVTAIVVATGWMLRLPPPIRRERPAVAAAALLGGFLNGSTSMGGPPPALLASLQRWPVQESRLAMATFNLASYAVAIVVGISAGAADLGFLTLGLLLLPAAVAGNLAGSWSARRISTAGFRYVLIGVVWLAGATSLLTTLT